MKRKLVSAILTVALATAVVFAPMQKAQAGVGGLIIAFGGTQIVAILGGAISVGSLIAMYTVDTEDPFAGLGMFAWMMLGVIILDEDGSQAVRYSHIGPEQAETLGVSLDDAEVFNGEVEEVNAILGTISGELSALEAPSLEDAQAAWDKYGDNLQPGSRRVIDKISIAVDAQLAN
jgi:hypothetical protein